MSKYSRILSYILLPLSLCPILPTAYANEPPLFKNSITSTEFDFISHSDPSSFESISYLGTGRREMPDRRKNTLFDLSTYLFQSSFYDAKIDIWVHSDFRTKEVALQYAMKLSGPLGKLPYQMRQKLSHVVVQKGDLAAFAEDKGQFFVVYSDNIDIRINNNDFEETVFHESVHATLDFDNVRSTQWKSVQKLDSTFITEYAANFPEREDLAETALFVYTAINNPSRLPVSVVEWMSENIPNKLAYIKRLFD